jgi:DNA repair ATPase RecN
MNISQALKEKNRIAGRIVKLQKQVQQYNQFRENKTQDFNARDLLKSLQEECAYLIDTKSKIAKANQGISDKLVQLAEAKSELVFWTSFNSGSAQETFNESKYIECKHTYVDVKGGHNIPVTEVQEYITRVQTLVETLQDEIDNYNATTQI